MTERGSITSHLLNEIQSLTSGLENNSVLDERDRNKQIVLLRAKWNELKNIDEQVAAEQRLIIQEKLGIHILFRNYDHLID